MKETRDNTRFKYLDVFSRAMPIFKSSLVINAIYILGVNLLPAGIGFFYWGIASRLYTISEIGIATGFISAATLIAGLSVIGMNIGIMRFLPDSKNPNELLNTTYSFIFLNSVLLSMIYLFGTRIWANNLNPILINPFLKFIFILLVLVTSLGNITRGTFIARKQSNVAFLYTLFSHLIRIALISVIVLGIIGSNLIGYLVALLVNVFIFMPRVEKDYKLAFVLNFDTIKRLVPFSAGNYLADFLSNLGITILPLMILEQLGAEANGIAYIPLLIGGMLASPGTALGRSAFVEGSNSIANSNQTLLKSTILGFFVTFLLSIGFIVLAPFILGIFGKNFLTGTQLLRWMAIGSPVFVLNQFFFNYLRLQKNIKRLLLLSVLIFISTIGITGYLLPKAGISAAGIGVLAGNLVTAGAIALIFFIRKRDFSA